MLYGRNKIAADCGINVRVELPARMVISGFFPRPAIGFRAKADRGAAVSNLFISPLLNDSELSKLTPEFRDAHPPILGAR